VSQFLSKTEQYLLIGFYTNKKKLVKNNHDYIVIAELIKKDFIVTNGYIKHDKRKIKYLLTERGFILASLLHDLYTGIIHLKPEINSPDYKNYYFRQTLK
jgi:hypothetical protein